MATYSSSLLRQIRKTTFNNFSISHLDNNIRSRIISLGIHKQHIPRPYRCSRTGNNLFQKILIICSNTSGIKPFHQQLGPNQVNLITPSIAQNRSVLATLSHINVWSIVNKTSIFSGIHNQSFTHNMCTNWNLVIEQWSRPQIQGCSTKRIRYNLQTMTET